MKIFWHVNLNCLISASPCQECKGFVWRTLSEATDGLWEEMGCRNHEPDPKLTVLVQSDFVAVPIQEQSLSGDQK